VEVVLVHRPEYDGSSPPEGKLTAADYNPALA